MDPDDLDPRHLDSGHLDQLSDDELVARVRAGDKSAYAPLWRRHSGAAYRVALSFTTLDADDLVSEAFTRVLEAILRGGGPSTGFRPYLTTAVRNVGRSRYVREPLPLDHDLDGRADLAPGPEESAITALESSATLAAFRSLPDRWQEVLWYAEVDELKPRHISRYLGVPPNAVSALIRRARRGFRDAWITVHLAKAATEECRAAVEAMGAYTRAGLPDRTHRQLETHLAGCASCPEALREAQHLARLALVLLPVVAGAAGAAAYDAATPAPVAAGVSDAPFSPPSAPSGRTPLIAAAVSALVVGAAAAAFALVTGALAGGIAVPASPHTSLPITAPDPGTAPTAPPAPADPLGTPTPPVSPPAPERPERPDASRPTPRPTSGGAPTPDPSPTPAASPTPSMTPSPTPTVDPVALPAPTVVLSQPDGRMYPHLSGMAAAPFAGIRVIDDAGATVATTTARADGDWSLRLTEGGPGGHRVVVRQAVGGLLSPPSPPVAFHLAEPPTATTPVDAATVPAAGFAFRFRADPGVVIQREIVGVTPIQTLRTPVRGEWNEYRRLPPGTYTLRLRHAAPETGDVGPFAVTTFIVE